MLTYLLPSAGTAVLEHQRAAWGAGVGQLYSPGKKVRLFWRKSGRSQNPDDIESHPGRLALQDRTGTADTNQNEAQPWGRGLVRTSVPWGR